jgi:hypothetical protein
MLRGCATLGKGKSTLLRDNAWKSSVCHVNAPSIGYVRAWPTATSRICHFRQCADFIAPHPRLKFDQLLPPQSLSLTVISHPDCLLTETSVDPSSSVDARCAYQGYRLCETGILREAYVKCTLSAREYASERLILNCSPRCRVIGELIGETDIVRRMQSSVVVHSI